MRETVAAADGCLDDLDAAQRRVISLRAGVGPGPARSRGAVAKRLDITVSRVARLERSGLKRLKSLTKAGQCAPPVQSGGTATQGVVASGSPDAVVAGTGSSKGAGKNSQGGGDGSSAGGAGKDEGADADRAGVAGGSFTNLPLVSSGGAGWLILLVALVLVAVAARALIPTLLRRRRDHRLARDYATGAHRATFAAATPRPAVEKGPRLAPVTSSSLDLPPGVDHPDWKAAPAPEAPGGSDQWAVAPPAAPETPEDTGWTDDADPTKSSQRLPSRRR